MKISTREEAEEVITDLSQGFFVETSRIVTLARTVLGALYVAETVEKRSNYTGIMEAIRGFEETAEAIRRFREGKE